MIFLLHGQQQVIPLLLAAAQPLTPDDGYVVGQGTGAVGGRLGLAGHLGQVIHLLTGKDLGQRGQIRGQTLLGLAPQGIEGTAQQGGGELLPLQIIHPAE